ncbi:MAG TPA: pyridoxamine 5'-phosphate oxidase family protein [Actinomycetota bacterium]|nr:pyridoxamine 5'-phosphate oxidase family protein [Actinomycetota bacterium]
MTVGTSRKLEAMDRAECIKYIEKHPAQLGRISVAGPRPVILPVNYVVDGDYVVIRTDPGRKFDAALHANYVAFEVDWVEPTWHRGWSVLIRGQARLVTDPEEIMRLVQLPLFPWAEGRTPIGKEHFVKIEMELVSGRKLM